MAQLARDAEGNLFQWSASAGQYVPSSEGTGFEAAGAGAWNSAASVVEGAGDVLTGAGASVAEALGADRAAQGLRNRQQGFQASEQARARENEGLQNRNPIAFGAGSAGPAVALGVATSGLGLLPTAAIEGGLGAISGTGRTAGERMLGAGIGAALGGTGYVLGAGLGRLGSKVGSEIRQAGASAEGRAIYNGGRAEILGPPGGVLDNLTGGQPAINQAGQRGLAARIGGRFATDAAPNARAIGDAEALGFKLTPADQVGSRSMKNLESNLQSNAFGQGPFQRIQNQNQDLFNDYAAKAIGLDDLAPGSKLSPEVIGAAETRVSDGFEGVARRVGKVDLTGSREAGRRAALGLDLTDEAEKAFQVINKIPDSANGASAYGRYARIRTLEEAARARNEVDFADALGTTADAILDDIAEAGGTAVNEAGETTRQTIQRLQEQYLVLQSVKSAVTTEGDVPIAQLANRLAKGKYSKSKWTKPDGTNGLKTEGARNLFKAARTMVNFKDRVGNSGTATRLGGGLDIAQGLLQRPLVEAYLGNPLRAAGGTGVAIGAGLAGSNLVGGQ